MNTEIIIQWENNKNNLREWFQNTPQSEYDEYKKIVIAICKLILVEDEWNIDKITEIDDGDYQGMKLFLIPKGIYQPSIEDYIYTYVDYGSCSGCDTLQSISKYTDGLPSEDQVNGYMTLALHIIQKMKTFKDE